MRMKRTHRLAVLTLALPALLAGGVMSAGSSSAAPLASAGLASAALTGAADAAALPAGCRASDGMYFMSRSDVKGAAGKLIGHASFYQGSAGNVCVIMWRNGVARGNYNLNGAHIKIGNSQYDTSLNRSTVRSVPLQLCVWGDSFEYWGGVKYKGVWYTTPRKRVYI